MSEELTGEEWWRNISHRSLVYIGEPERAIREVKVLEVVLAEEGMIFIKLRFLDQKANLREYHDVWYNKEGLPELVAHLG